MKNLTSGSLGFIGAAGGGLAMFFTLYPQSPLRAQSAGIFDSTPITVTQGQQIYEQICQGCHMPDAKGAVGAGRYPALAGDRALASRQYMALTVLMGRRNMPAFGAQHSAFGAAPGFLSSLQIAAVINYIRTHFGNHFKDAITPEEVKALQQTAR